MRKWNTQVLAAIGLLMAAAPAIAQERAPEIAPGGTVVLRGSTPVHAASQPPPPEPSNPASAGSKPRSALVPAYGWDSGGFDNRFDRSGLTPR